MAFYRNYELIDPLSGEGTRSFRARQIATGREVTVHLLTGGKTPENEALLARLRTLPEASLRKLIEVGDRDGATLVATEGPPFLHLAEWLTEQERARDDSDEAKYTHAGSWKIPTAPPSTAATGPGMPLPEPASGPAASGPDEFTRMFLGEAAPAPAPVVSEPGDFTRQFQASQFSPAPAPVAKPEPPDLFATRTMQIPIPRNLPLTEKTEPAAIPITGEFGPAVENRGSEPPPEPISAKAAPVTGQPGEFTRMFEAAKLAPENRVAEAAPEAVSAKPGPVAGQAGEFTRMFGAAGSGAENRAGEAAPEAVSAKSGPVAGQAGEFTRMFEAARSGAENRAAEAPPEAASAKAGPVAGEAGSAPQSVAETHTAEPLPAVPKPEPETGQSGAFTRMFQAPPQPPTSETLPQAVPLKPGGPGEFTRVFNAPLPSAPAPGDWPAQAAKPAAPGEFTRMFQAPPSRPEQSTAQQPPAEEGEFTRMFNARRSSSTSSPQFPSPANFPTVQPQPPDAVQPKAGEFTQMFGRLGAGAAPPPPSSPGPSTMQPDYGSRGSQATGAFRTPTVAPAPAGGQQGPSEYTQMMRAPSGGKPAPTSDPGTSETQVPMSQGRMKAPQMPQIKVQMPQMQMPKVSITPPQAPKMPSLGPVKLPGPNLLLIAIFCLLAFLVGAGLMVLLLKK